MPSIVAVSVRNCAIASNTFAAMSLSGLISIEVNARSYDHCKFVRGCPCGEDKNLRK